MTAHHAGPGGAKAGNRRWLEEFGGLLGMRVADLPGQAGIEAKHLVPYTYPTDADLSRVGATGIFLGYYLPWDGYQNALFAQAHGFETFPTTVEGSLVDYENLDNLQTGIHYYFRFRKYGFGRAPDIACNHIRRGRLTRADGLKLATMHDGKFPWTYLGEPIERVLEAIDMTLEEFVAVCDRFTNKRLFVCDRHGELVKDARGNLTKINADNLDD